MFRQLLLVALAIGFFSQTIYSADVIAPVAPAKTCRNWRRLFAKVAVGTVTLPIATCTAIEQIRKDSSSVRSADFNDKNLGRGAVKMANYGDSLSTGFHVDEQLVSLDEMRTLRTTGSAFADPSATKPYRSVFRRLLNESIPTNSVTFARVGAAVLRYRPLTTWQVYASTMMDLGDQVRAAAKEEVFPNLHVLWIGHNDLNWSLDVLDGSVLEKEHIENLPALFQDKYSRDLSVLLNRAMKETRKTAFVIFGLADIEGAMPIRNEIDEIRKKDPARYPFSNGLFQAFPAMLPANLPRTGIVQRNFNRKLESLVKALQEKYHHTQLSIAFSDSITKITPQLENFNEYDGFHLSDHGRESVATAVWNSDEFKRALEFIR